MWQRNPYMKGLEQFFSIVKLYRLCLWLTCLQTRIFSGLVLTTSVWDALFLLLVIVSLGSNVLCTINCTNIHKLEIMDWPFGDLVVLLELKNNRSLWSQWISSSYVTIHVFLKLFAIMHSLNVGVVHDIDQFRDISSRWILLATHLFQLAQNNFLATYYF
jgi:hypothetical protein